MFLPFRGGPIHFLKSWSCSETQICKYADITNRTHSRYWIRSAPTLLTKTCCIFASTAADTTAGSWLENKQKKTSLLVHRWNKKDPQIFMPKTIKIGVLHNKHHVRNVLFNRHTHTHKNNRPTTTGVGCTLLSWRGGVAGITGWLWGFVCDGVFVTVMREKSEVNKGRRNQIPGEKRRSAALKSST